MNFTPNSDAQGGDTLPAILSIALDRTSSASLVRQLYSQLRNLILKGRLEAGRRLPSTRKLAKELGVSRTVTMDAFEQLTFEGFLTSTRGSGHFVQALEHLSNRPVDRPISAAEPRDMPGDMEVESGRPFDPDWQAVDLFPKRVWMRSLSRGWRRHCDLAVARPWAGLPSLRTALAEHLEALRGLRYTSDQILVTSGAGDALQLISRSFADARAGSASCWIEDPCFEMSRQALRRENVQPVAVPVDEEGIRVDEGIRLAPQAALALVTPTRQFPLGMPLSLKRRIALLNWATESGMIIIEDDYDSEIRFQGRPIEALSSLAPEGRILTLGSFSKVTFPGLRLGYVAGPASLIELLVRRRQQDSVLVPTVGQVGLADFISSGGLVRHLRNLRPHLVHRRNLLVQVLEQHFGEFVRILPQQVGMHLTVLLHDDQPGLDQALAARARRLGLTIRPLSPQFASGQGPNGLLLGYAGWSDDQFGSSLARLIELLSG